MIDMISICGVGILAAVTALLLRRQSPQSALMLSVSAGVIVILSAAHMILNGVNDVTALLSQGGVDADSMMILLKAMGICFITEFTCDCVTEAGLMSLATNISFAGKAIVLVTAIPLFRRILELVTSFGGT